MGICGSNLDSVEALMVEYIKMKLQGSQVSTPDGKWGNEHLMIGYVDDNNFNLDLPENANWGGTKKK